MPQNTSLKELKAVFSPQIKQVIILQTSSIKSISNMSVNLIKAPVYNLLLNMCSGSLEQCQPQTLLSKYPHPLPSLTLESLCLPRRHCLLPMLQKVIHSLIITDSEAMMMMQLPVTLIMTRRWRWRWRWRPPNLFSRIKKESSNVTGLLMETSLSRIYLNWKLFKVGSRTWYLTLPDHSLTQSQRPFRDQFRQVPLC